MARLSIGLMEGEEDLDVLVTPEDSTPLVGKDHPHFLSSLNKLLKDEPPALLMGRSMAPNVAPEFTVPEENNSVQDNGNVTETVAAVKTRRESAKEREEWEKHDIASAASGATPTPLQQVRTGIEEMMDPFSEMDDSLFLQGTCRPQLTRREKRLQARQHILSQKDSTDSRVTTLV